MLNFIALQGHLTKDPELRSTPNGKSVCTFTLAVNRDGKDAGADFINCVAWEKTAEFVCRYFKKGSPAVVRGRIQSRQYEKDGQKRTAVEAIVDSIYFGGSKPGEEKNTFGSVEDTDGDLPF